MEISGLEEFRLRTAKQLSALGSAKVTVSVWWTTPPVNSLLRLSPAERRRAVLARHRRGIRELLASAPGARRIRGQKGMFELPARALPRLPRIPGIGPLWIESVEGLRKRRRPPRRPLFWTWAARVRLVQEIAGKRRGNQYVDERTVIVRAWNDKAARRQVERHFKRSPYVTPYVEGSDPVRWRVESIGDVRRVLVDPLRDGVTTVWWEGRERRIPRGSGWKV